MSVSAKAIEAYLDEATVTFHQRRCERLREIRFRQVVKKKGLHLLKARNTGLAGDLVKCVLDDLVSSIDQRLFRQFLDDIALFVARKSKRNTNSAFGDHEVAFAYRGNRHTLLIRTDPTRVRAEAPSRHYRKIVGRDFCYLVSSREVLYIDIIQPLGQEARQHYYEFQEQMSRVMNLFTQEFIADFCIDGAIDWKKLVEFNSGNLNLSEIRG